MGLNCLQEIHCIEVFESMQVTEYTFNQTPDVIQYGLGLQHAAESLSWPPSSA